MQLKTVGESLTVLDTFDNIFDGLEELDLLSDKLKACSVDSVKLAISQRALSKEQIKTALSAAGLEGEILETTTAELTQVVADKQLAKSKAEAAGSTTGLGTAMKGLWNVLKTNPLFWIGTAITAVTTVAFKCADAIKEVRDKASDLSNEFNSSQSDIESYKTQIEDLYKVINDSGSSIEEVTTARQNLMTIQDQLIEKFGDEKETIDLITQAIYGQTTALDTLTQKQWQATKNEFNKSNGFWNGFTNFFGGYSDNIDRMLDEYGDYNTRIDMSIFSQTGKWNGEDTEKALKQLEELGYTISRTNNGTGVPFIELSGNASEVYDDLLEIQNLLSDESFGASDSFKNHLTSLANEANDISKTYEDMYNQYVLYEEVFTNSDYKQSFKDINDAYKEYQDAFATGDQETIDKAVANFSNILTQATDGAKGDESVIDYFNSMYPELTAIVDKWEFKTNIIPKFDTTGIQGMSESDILKMTQTDGLQEGEEVFNSILAKANEYNLVTGTTNEQIEQLIDLLIEWGILQGDIADKLQEGNETGILSYEEQLSGVESLSKGLDQLSDIYKDVKDVRSAA